jgi:hypothetical protein
MSVRLSVYPYGTPQRQQEAGNLKTKSLEYSDFGENRKKNYRYIKPVSKCDQISKYLAFIIDIHNVFFRIQAEVEEIVTKVHKKNNFKSPRFL